MIDTHCHLTASDYIHDFEDVLDRCRREGLSRIITIAETLMDSKTCCSICDEFVDVFCSIGIHPHYAQLFSEKSIRKLEELADHPSVVAIGEIGLDYHYPSMELRAGDHLPQDLQRVAFEQQLCLARDLNLPAVVHTRDALEDTWSIVDTVGPQKLVIHCCSERFEDVECFLDAGYFLSFTGIATFPKSDVIRETIRRTPMERIMAETDAPFLAPVPHRGKRCEPWMVRDVIACIAECKGIDAKETERILDENARAFFGLPY